MAMSKADFIELGEQIYRNAGDRPFGGSWQIKAQQIGFDCAQTDAFDARQDEAKALAIELDGLAEESSPHEGVSKGSNGPVEASENQSEGVSSLEPEATGVEGPLTLAQSVTATGQSVVNEMILKNDVLSGMVTSDTDTLWQTKTPEQIVSDMRSLMQELKQSDAREYEPPIDARAHHIESLIEQAVREPNVKRAQRLMSKINHLRLRQMKLVSVYMRNGNGLCFIKD